MSAQLLAPTSKLNRLVLGTVMSFFLVLGSASALAGERGERHLERMTKELNLTSEQQEKLKKIHSEVHSEMKSKREATKAAHDDLDRALRGNASVEEIRAKFAKLQKVQDEFAKARFEKVLSVRAILTADQRKNFKSSGFRHGFKHRRDGRHGSGEESSQE